jgi:hypothetical protein
MKWYGAGPLQGPHLAGELELQAEVEREVAVG